MEIRIRCFIFKFFKNHKPISMMQIEQPIFSTIFQKIELLTPTKGKCQRVCVQNQFSTLPYNTEDILITLSDNILFISSLGSELLQPYAFAELNFDLKFQVLFTKDKDIYSGKVGIKLYKSNDVYFKFYSDSRAQLESWIFFLTKKLNQKGFHEMFKPLRKLGKGNFASVYEVERITDKKKFAVKAFSKQNSFSAKNGKESLINELSVMRQLSLEPHHNVLKLEGVYESDNSIYVVLQLLDGGQLYHKIQQANGYFSKQQVQECIKGLLMGLEHMHKNRIMHRDIKPENIMVRNGLNPVIVDFGLATPVDIDNYLFFRCGTPGYVAPEIIELNESKPIEPECDIFSVGVIFHILTTRKALFEGSKYDEVYKKNKKMQFDLNTDFYKKFDSNTMDLMKKILEKDPKKRLKASQALKHPYFGGSSNNIINKDEKLLNSPVLTNTSQKKKTGFLFF